MNIIFDFDLQTDHLLTIDYLPTKFEASRTKHCLVISSPMYGALNMTFDLDLRPTDLNINWNHLLIQDHLPT